MLLLEINPLVLPEIGLVFWSTVAFLLLIVVLTKFAWKPIMAAIKEREQGIEDALAKAERMQADMAKMQSENEALMAKAREERAVLIKEAKEQSDKMIAAAKEKAKAEYDKLIGEAQQAIQQQKNAALVDVKNHIGNLVIEVSEKILKRELADKAAQEAHIKTLTEQVKLN
ncbi:MAG: ATP synthase F0 subunit B [Bacteroidetes bacterium]|jgi:F-type H+-transporting ATPase subunit b|nr:MAG: ATP synthase F0 subunit B [Bacteroidota bacterium]TAF90974.1 MAG: ATP synthase F0 subunit B [Bacteroidota bacterium]